jgi:hypothetical protein
MLLWIPAVLVCGIYFFLLVANYYYRGQLNYCKTCVLCSSAHQAGRSWRGWRLAMGFALT